MVGATGRQESKTDNPDGTATFRFVQEDVHDFAWTASRRFLERRARFEEPGYPPVDIRLLLQPEHAHLGERYLERHEDRAAQLRRLVGALSLPADHGGGPGVELGLGRDGVPDALHRRAPPGSRPRSCRAPRASRSTRPATSSGTGSWRNNEFEEAWLDEGFNTLPRREGVRPLRSGPRAGAAATSASTRAAAAASAGRSWPPACGSARGSESLAGLRQGGEADVMARRAWEYRDSASYGLNSYGKPALACRRSRGCVGDETMTRILRTYARRYRFAHPTTRGLHRHGERGDGRGLALVLRRDLLLVRPVRLRGRRSRASRVRKPDGYFRGRGRRARAAPARRTPKRGKDEPGERYESRVTVVRLGEVRMPVEVRVEFADGRVAKEQLGRPVPLDRFRYRGAKVVRAVVDPDRKIALDVDPANNSWLDDERPGAPRGGEVGGALPVLAPEPARAAHGAGLTRCSARCATAAARCGLNWGLVVLVLAANLAMAAVLAVPLALQLDKDLAHRGASSAMMYGFDYAWWSAWSEQQQQGPASATSARDPRHRLRVPEPRAAAEGPAAARALRARRGSRGSARRSRDRSGSAALYLVLQTFLTGGLVSASSAAARRLDAARARSTAPASTSGACCGSPAGAGRRRAACSRSTPRSRAGSTTRRARRSRDGSAVLLTLGRHALLLVALLLLHMVVSHAQVIVVLEERLSRRARGALEPRASVPGGSQRPSGSTW